MTTETNDDVPSKAAKGEAPNDAVDATKPEAKKPESPLEQRDNAVEALLRQQRNDRDNSDEADTRPDFLKKTADPDEVSGDPENNDNLSEQSIVDNDDKSGEDADNGEPSASGELLDILKDRVYAKDGVPTVRLKVDGKEIEMPFDKVIADRQKNLAADLRLHNAAQTEKELNQFRSDLETRRAELDLREKSLTQLPTDSVSGDEVNEEAKKIVSSLFHGSEEDAMDTVAKLLLKPAPKIDLDAIRQEAIEVARAEVRNEFQQRQTQETARSYDDSLRSGIAKVNEAYPGILDDSFAYTAIDAQTSVLESNNPEWSPEKILFEAAKETAKRLGFSPATDTSTPPVSDESRHEAKAKLTRVPRPVSSQMRHQRTVEEKPDNSPLGVLERMAEARRPIKTTR